MELPNYVYGKETHTFLEGAFFASRVFVSPWLGILLKHICGVNSGPYSVQLLSGDCSLQVPRQLLDPTTGVL